MKTTAQQMSRIFDKIVRATFFRYPMRIEELSVLIVDRFLTTQELEVLATFEAHAGETAAEAWLEVLARECGCVSDTPAPLKRLRPENRIFIAGVL